MYWKSNAHAPRHTYSSETKPQKFPNKEVYAQYQLSSTIHEYLQHPVVGTHVVQSEPVHPDRQLNKQNNKTTNKQTNKKEMHNNKMLPNQNNCRLRIFICRNKHWCDRDWAVRTDMQWPALTCTVQDCCSSLRLNYSQCDKQLQKRWEVEWGLKIKIIKHNLSHDCITTNSSFSNKEKECNAPCLFYLQQREDNHILNDSFASLGMNACWLFSEASAYSLKSQVSSIECCIFFMTRNLWKLFWNSKISFGFSTEISPSSYSICVLPCLNRCKIKSVILYTLPKHLLTILEEYTTIAIH